MDVLEKLRYTVRLSEDLPARFTETMVELGEILYTRSTQPFDFGGNRMYPHDIAFVEAERVTKGLGKTTTPP